MLIKFHSNQFHSPCVSIASTSYELLAWIKDKTNMGTIKSKKNYNPKVHKNSYTYTLRYNEAISLLEIITPYLIIPQKKFRAQMIIDEYKRLTPRNGRYNEHLRKEKEEFYNKFMTIQ